MKNSKFRKILIVLFYLVLWEIISRAVDNSILIAGPVKVIEALLANVRRSDFYISTMLSFLKIGAGFFVGAFLGIALAIAAYNSETVAEFLSPIMAFLKAAPVASFVVLFLIWWHSNVLSIAICICVALPQFYVNLLRGLKSTNKQLLELGDVFKFSLIDRIHYIYRPSVYDYLESAVKISAGMAWKAGIAAEVIGNPAKSIGSNLYTSKIYLDTAGVLSWTLVVILMSVICERILMHFIRKYRDYEFKCKGSRILKDNADRKLNESLIEMSLENVSKSYDGKAVIEDYSQTFASGNIYRLDWPSGGGKTTLFKIIAGIATPDSGILNLQKASISMVFQEDRLVDDFSAIKNVELVCADRVKSEGILCKLLDKDTLYKPVRLLSGGQRRRVAIARALSLDADIAIFDEPYEGLDEAARDKAMKAIAEYGKDKIVLIASHIE